MLCLWCAEPTSTLGRAGGGVGGGGVPAAAGVFKASTNKHRRIECGLFAVSVHVSGYANL